MKRFDEINVIPMIDVMLVLLAIVLTTASFITQDKLALELPETSETDSYQPKDSKPLKIALNSENQWFLNETTTSFSALTLALKTIDPKTEIEIRIDQNAKFGQFTRLIDLLKANQLNNLNILTRKQNA